MKNNTLNVSRVINAPIELVWQAWTDAAQVAKWWGPNGVTNDTCVWEARPGGKIDLIVIAGKELGPLAGQKWRSMGQFKEVEPMKKLVYTSDARMQDKPVMEALTTVTFEAQADKTKLSVHIQVTKTTPQAAGALPGMEMGWNQQLDKMANSLKEV